MQLLPFPPLRITSNIVLNSLQNTLLMFIIHFLSIKVQCPNQMSLIFAILPYSIEISAHKNLIPYFLRFLDLFSVLQSQTDSFFPLQKMFFTKNRPYHFFIFFQTIFYCFMIFCLFLKNSPKHFFVEIFMDPVSFYQVSICYLSFFLCVRLNNFNCFLFNPLDFIDILKQNVFLPLGQIDSYKSVPVLMGNFSHFQAFFTLFMVFFTILLYFSYSKGP